MIRAAIIGIDRYHDAAIAPLHQAVADARAFASALSSRFSSAELDIMSLHDEAATKRDIAIAVADVLSRSARADDAVVLYFAGHGSPEAEDRSSRSSRYLVVHDTDYENIGATGIELEHELVRWIERIALPRLVAVFIDACFSGLAGGRTFEGPHLRRMRDRRPLVRDVALHDLDFGEGRLIMTACDDDQVARESSSLGHGIFTYYLLETLTSQSWSAPMIDLVSLYQEVATKVREHTQGEQIPVINGRSRMARFPMLSSTP